MNEWMNGWIVSRCLIENMPTSDTDISWLRIRIWRGNILTYTKMYLYTDCILARKQFVYDCSVMFILIQVHAFLMCLEIPWHVLIPLRFRIRPCLPFCDFTLSNICVRINYLKSLLYRLLCGVTKTIPCCINGQLRIIIGFLPVKDPD